MKILDTQVSVSIIPQASKQASKQASLDTAVYGSYLIDDEALLQSASGGVAAALAEQTIKEGGYVAGVVWSDDFRRAHYALFHSLDDLPKLRGSKYIEAECGSIYSDVKRLIDDGQSVLFIGLPCTVAAVKQFVGSDDGGLLTCELICHGPTSAKVHEEYVERLEKR